MTKPAGESDKLRAFTEDPELRALMEQLDAAPAGETQPILEAFIAKAYALHPDWRETLEAAESDGRIVHALFIHSLKEARARPELTDLDRLEIAELEAEFVMRFDILSVAARVSAAAQGAIRLASVVQRMTLIAGVGPEEAKRIGRQAVRERALELARLPKRTPGAKHARKLFDDIRNDHPEFDNAQIVKEIPNRWRLKDNKGRPIACFTDRWLTTLVNGWRPGSAAPPPAHPRRRRTYPLKRFQR